MVFDTEMCITEIRSLLSTLGICQWIQCNHALTATIGLSIKSKDLVSILTINNMTTQYGTCMSKIKIWDTEGQIHIPTGNPRMFEITVSLPAKWPSDIQEHMYPIIHVTSFRYNIPADLLLHL